MLHSVTDFVLPIFVFTKFTISTHLQHLPKDDSPKSVPAEMTPCSIAVSHVFSKPGTNLTDLLLCGVLTPLGDLENNIGSL